ncbi:Os04g0180500 [Oryza sativa Japonica Group]|uniref:Os04g0180500 protein n=1 Tax=Oryza sativa subsp. japonica TaxID=39947 RepID=A0A0P0W7T7_ORYSJ|nr:hypothetical protein EE612_022296 [Oryza sativa]BAS87956.1 Os04g0180500 [Oryza sativa Japonica Group]
MLLALSDDLVEDGVQLPACSPQAAPQPGHGVDEPQRREEVAEAESAAELEPDVQSRQELLLELDAARLPERRLGGDRVRARREQPGEGDRLLAAAAAMAGGGGLDVPDEGQRLVIPDRRELPHHLGAEELHRAELAQHPPVGAVGREADVEVVVAEDLRDEEARPRREHDVLVAEHLLRRRRR